MSQIQELHKQAMDLAEAAFTVKLRGDLAQAIQLYRQALDKESQAAALIADKLDAEPTRSVLHRSAASLAIDCGEFRVAERLIAIALSGNPPQEIAEELKDLFIQINLRPYLERHGLAFDEQKLSTLTLDKKSI
jgi:tetratricopeptide (TPR) repeat protein